ncbi:MAG: acetyl-CoA carboxylase carboxyl transferase subunit beta [Acidimicrobiales bacterium]|nr:acetyl-CoA carboxylase carboxyl transferase subunit beta [Acidimicrobiales bacterium]
MPPHPVLEEWDADLRSGDPLRFPGYADRVARAPGEAVRTGRAAHYAFVEGDGGVFGGSMGAAAGEKIVRAYRRAVDLALPILVVTRSSGARLQEGMVALVQLARTVDAAGAHAAAGLLSLAVHASPTTGGALASYASLADVRVAEPGAILGFASPRVVERVLGTRLPERSHTSEGAYANGLLDGIVGPAEQAAWVESALGLRATPLPTRPLPAPDPIGVIGPWGEVLRARAVGRPTGIDRAARLCTSWTELRDRDPVVRAGLATVAGRRVVMVATDRYVEDGRPVPAGYRLAQRAIALAGRLGLPLVTLVDTPGAHPGPESEADHVAGEIARTFAAMAALPTPSVSVVVGEGGSAGALALACGDRLLLQEHAVFSVIPPEGAAAMMHQHPSAADLAPLLRLTSADLLGLGVADEVIAEGQAALEEAVVRALDEAVPGDRSRRFDTVTRAWLR